MELTPEQKEASTILWESNYQSLQLIAGAGTGKTATLIKSVFFAIQHGYLSKEICLITFTKKAATEMKGRLLSIDIQVGFVGTMHALGYYIIRKTTSKKFNILTNKTSILKKIVEEQFAHLKGIPTDFLLSESFSHTKEYKEIYDTYSQYKKQHQYYDLDDLILRSTELLDKQSFKSPFKILFIDEFQDTSPEQIKFIQSLKTTKLFTVGDDWQSIYKFRGANIQIMNDFSQYFLDSKKLFLTNNFRSQKNIVKLSNQFIQLSDKYISKKLKSNLDSPFKPTFIFFDKRHLHYYHINVFTEWFHKNFSTTHKKEKLTILVRTNFILNQIVNHLKLPNIIVMTIHASKGLEFDNVLVYGIVYKEIPHKWGDFNEEIRIMYVAMTRAKKRLFFLGWEENNVESEFQSFLLKKANIQYL